MNPKMKPLLCLLLSTPAWLLAQDRPLTSLPYTPSLEPTSSTAP